MARVETDSLVDRKVDGGRGQALSSVCHRKSTWDD